MKAPFVTSAVSKRIATITFYHPQGNSMPKKLLSELTQCIEHAGNDDNVSVIVLKSEGEKAFCAGASFDELTTIQNLESGKQFFGGFSSVINAIRTAPKFVIARIQGKCVGGGVGIACAADYAVALNNAAVKLSELSIGIGPFVIAPAVERKIGKAAFTQLAINATAWQSAQWAREKGMFATLCDSLDDLDQTINELSLQLSQANMETTRELKNIFWEGTEHWEQLLHERAEIVSKLALNPQVKKNIQRIKNK